MSAGLQLQHSFKVQGCPLSSLKKALPVMAKQAGKAAVCYADEQLIIDPHSQVKGLFWNYYSVGLDAQAAYGFHSLREKRPWATPTRTINQGWYSYFSCTSGWFCNAPPVRNKIALKVSWPC